MKKLELCRLNGSRVKRHWCCMGSSGQDTYLINGLYDANKAGNPVIAIASTIHTHKMGLDNFQETRPESLFQDCSKYVFQASTPKQAINGLQTAIQHAISMKGLLFLDSRCGFSRTRISTYS
jgi:pyruvate dehydrogenase (quinone)